MSHLNVSLSRRQFLRSTAAASAALVAVPSFSADDWGGLKVGLQSYTLRNFNTDEAMAHCKKLGISYWESFPKHVPMTTVPGQIAAAKKQLSDGGITLLAYGVLGFDGNETKAREAFDFAKAMGLMSISADPTPDNKTFDLLDKLVAEYDIAIGIHNHGPGHRYDKASDVEKVVKDRHPKIGACVDTGHYLRSDENPVEIIERLGKRVFGVHLKDVRTIRDPQEQEKAAAGLPKGRVDQLKKEGKLFTILGEGELDVKGCLALLKKQNFQYCVALEYEENAENPISDIELCLKTVRKSL
jgi:inosose dehydratase